MNFSPFRRKLRRAESSSSSPGRSFARCSSSIWEAQRVHAPRLLALVHLEGADLAMDFCKGLILFSICIQKLFRLSKAVEIQLVLLLVEQLLAIVLAVDVEQAAAERAQLRHGERPSVHAAGVFAVGVNLAQQQQLLVRLQPELPEQGGLHPGKRRTDKRLVRAGADQVA